MKHFTSCLALALLGFCLMGVTGCGEDNEAAVKQQEATVKDTNVPKEPPPKTMEEYAKRNPGMSGAATGSKKK
ncbi:hypothetical protein OJF2_38370 [Aquisphaera giovannonii]|uniref:Lipoprotein n=1 Tax=Aquisphaera giovannonii TaxID=406548 RepID=A0A5B9W521_9BACT|nr:hypothetical protein [Aquisphaera giovannonii]QEH35289.1 hypothetical protein OJF2_38370 [Aquisphaera giovannonii]